MINSTITKGSATGDDIMRIAQKIEQTCSEERTDHMIIAFISLSAILQNPTIDPNKLPDIVSSVSEFMCMLIDPAVVGTEDKPVVLN